MKQAGETEHLPKSSTLWIWRHPRARGAGGRCIGRTDLAVDPRKAKRLAHRIRQAARRQGLPHAVWVSPLQRSAAVGAWLRRWGFAVQVDTRLQELDFGTWDGQRWADIAWAEVQAWEDDLLRHAPGGGESVLQLAARVRAFADEAHSAVVQPQPQPRLLVGHAGWINALLHVPPGTLHLAAADWPPPVPHGALRRWP